ncbi:unnamed protein product [Ambrosiozyma monospora]|uniref:Unnamed protein product n=1 Tax=Ambrosiozyma monospora TaxID=43982 RepID=A0ACB5TL10_AMBMO|nr:unnamed protein product [Ambrosiozyma monospora]
MMLLTPQRVSLARALYSNSAYVLLDDCLSAVDSHTAVHIYENALTGDLMKNRTCILISHNVPLTVKHAEYVVVMDNGRVKAQGTVDDLITTDAFDAEVLKSIADSTTTTTKVGSSQNSTSSITEIEDEEVTNDHIAKGKLLDEETKSEGAVSREVYATYFHYFATGPNLMLILSFFIGAQICSVAESYWVRVWTLASSHNSMIANITTSVIHKYASFSITSILSHAQSPNWWFTPIVKSPASATISSVSHSPLYYVIVYCSIGVAFSIVNSTKAFVTFHCGLVASGQMFEDLLARILGANLRFANVYDT